MEIPYIAYLGSLKSLIWIKDSLRFGQKCYVFKVLVEDTKLRVILEWKYIIPFFQVCKYTCLCRMAVYVTYLENLLRLFWPWKLE